MLTEIENSIYIAGGRKLASIVCVSRTWANYFVNQGKEWEHCYPRFPKRFGDNYYGLMDSCRSKWERMEISSAGEAREVTKSSNREHPRRKWQHIQSNRTGNGETCGTPNGNFWNKSSMLVMTPKCLFLTWVCTLGNVHTHLLVPMRQLHLVWKMDGERYRIWVLGAGDKRKSLQNLVLVFEL